MRTVTITEEELKVAQEFYDDECRCIGEVWGKTYETFMDAPEGSKEREDAHEELRRLTRVTSKNIDRFTMLAGLAGLLA